MAKAKPREPSNHERLERLCRDLDIEMDGVSRIPATAAAILNGIRRVLGDIDWERDAKAEELAEKIKEAGLKASVGVGYGLMIYVHKWPANRKLITELAEKYGATAKYVGTVRPARTTVPSS